MKRLVKKYIKKVSPLIYLPEILYLLIIGKMKYKHFNKCWLICERGDEAKDNGYHLFKYIQNNKINNNSYFIIKKTSRDYGKICEYDNVIEYGSYEHKIAYLLSRCLISTHYHSINPWKYIDLKDFKRIYDLIIRKKKYIFLQHGIIMNDVSDYLGKKNTEFDLFICGAKPEYEYVKSNFGYDEDEVAYTGLARFDNLDNYKVKNQILLMPTWRSYLKIQTDAQFLNSVYYNRYQSLINNKNLISILDKYNYELVFYPHYEMQKYIKYFKSSSERVKLANNEENDVQELLKESKLLITDYSSVYFDFAYMEKPIIYYQFDIDEFYNNHYNKGYFSYDKDGFGKVVEYENKCINQIIKYFNYNFNIEEEYKVNINKFFKLRDKLNCKRIIDEIQIKLDI